MRLYNLIWKLPSWNPIIFHYVIHFCCAFSICKLNLNPRYVTNSRKILLNIIFRHIISRSPYLVTYNCELKQKYVFISTIKMLNQNEKYRVSRFPTDRTRGLRKEQTWRLNSTSTCWNSFARSANRCRCLL